MAAPEHRRDATSELVEAVGEGDEAGVRAVLARGARSTVTVTHDDFLIGNYCLLSQAAHLGHAHLLPHLLRAGFRVEGVSTVDKTPLMLAAAAGHTGAVEALLAAGANPAATDNEGCTALHFAAWKGQEGCVAALCRVTPRPAQDHRGRTPVHLATCGAHWKVVDQLRAASWPLHTLDLGGCSPLHYAAVSGCETTVKYLKDAGLDPCRRDKNGRSPGDVAVVFGQHGAQDCLEKGTGPRLPQDLPSTLDLIEMRQELDDQFYSLLLSCVKESSMVGIEDIPAVIDGHLVDGAGLTPLHQAAVLGRPRVVERLLARGVHPDVVSHEGLTPADLAHREGHQEVSRVLQNLKRPKVWGAAPLQLYQRLLGVLGERDDPREVSRLLRGGAPLEPVGPGQRPVLQLALTSDRCRSATLLLGAGAPLTYTLNSLNLLQQTWRSPHVTPGVLCALQRAYLGRLEEEKRRLGREWRRLEDQWRWAGKERRRLKEERPQLGKERRRLEEERRRLEAKRSRLGRERRRLDSSFSELAKGVDLIMLTLRGDAPWTAAWPKGVTPLRLTGLMTLATRSDCPVTAAFLRKAGAWPFVGAEGGASPLHAALEAEHWSLAEVLVRDLGGSPYLPNTGSRLPRDMMPLLLRQSLEQRLYQEERDRLKELQLREKDAEERLRAGGVRDLQAALFARYTGDPVPKGSAAASSLSSHALLVASRLGLLQLTHLLLREAGLPVDTVLDEVCGTTALHQAASYGQSACAALLLSAGADPLRTDRYGHTAILLAAMFGHKDTFQLLKALQGPEDPPSRAGATAHQTHDHFRVYLEHYCKCGDDTRGSLTPLDRQDATRVATRILEGVEPSSLVQEAQRATVDFSKEGAGRVKAAVLRELLTVAGRVATTHPEYSGTLQLVGSSRDGSKLYCPDEYDVNLVLRASDLTVEVEEDRGPHRHHRLTVQVSSERPELQGARLVAGLYDAVQQCLVQHLLDDTRLSLVPPGLTRTQVGVALSLAWRGEQPYPLLLVGVDLVPVLEVPWHPAINRPFLTPKDTATMHVSNTADGGWRCSFAQTEAEVLSRLNPEERLVQLVAKTEVSCLKAEPWMPRNLKAFYTWFSARPWTIPVPGGFCVKSSFLKWLEHKRRLQEEEEEEEEQQQCVEGSTVRAAAAVFRRMCAGEDCAPGEQLTSTNVPGYFGGECEGAKDSTGATIIVDHLEGRLTKPDGGAESKVNQGGGRSGNMGTREEGARSLFDLMMKIGLLHIDEDGD